MNGYEQNGTNGFCYDFENLLPTEENPTANCRIHNFLVTGPFVMETDGSPEKEHMYDRERILLEDYLAPDGGERNAEPQLHGRVTNAYLGAPFFSWEKGLEKWDSLRFDGEGDSACNEALYATPQRNAVFYAAFYIRCKKAEKAVLSYENSGCALFLNGEQIDFSPFGTVKGLPGQTRQCLLKLRRGKNLLLFKIRPGYIADTVDMSMCSCCVYPAVKARAAYLCAPAATLAYSGSVQKPCQLFPAWVYSERDADCKLFYEETVTHRLHLSAGEWKRVHLEVPVKETARCVKATVGISSGGETAYFTAFFNTVPYDGFTGTEHIVSDFHFDTTYHQEQRTYALGAFHITKSILEKILHNPYFKAIISEIDYLHPFFTLYPQYRAVLTRAFKEKRAEADCFYNQPNELTGSGEAFVRNLIYGQLYHRDVMGRMSRVYAPGDVFGHCSQLSQICKKGGCGYIKWGKLMLGVDRLFRYMSPDGSWLLHDKGFGRYDAVRMGLNDCCASSTAEGITEPYPRDDKTVWMERTLSHAEFSLFSELAEGVERDAAENPAIDLTSRDITLHHSGTLVTRTDFKQANRLCEVLLDSAERFCTVAALYGAKYPEKALDKAWRQLLCAQHHDSITGTNNEISFADLMIQYRECAFLASDALDRALKFLASGIKAQDRENSVFIFNSLEFDRDEPCSFILPETFDAPGAVLTDGWKEYPLLIEGRRALFMPPRVPATGFVTLRLKESAPLRVQKDNSEVIENSYFKVQVDSRIGGVITSIYDKKHGRELIDAAAGPANLISVLREEHNRMETQHELYTSGEKLCSQEFKAQVTSEKCSFMQRLKIRVKLGTIGVLRQEITLYKNGASIDFLTVIEDYAGEDDLFTVSFPMDICGAQAVFDDRFAAHVSTRSKNEFSYQTHQYAAFSGCRILPSCQWFGAGPTVTVKMGCGASVNIGMTALIRKEALSETAERLLTALTKKGVPVTPYPDGYQHGGDKIIHFNEDIYSTDTRFVLAVSGDKNEYVKKLTDGFSAGHKRIFNAQLENSGCAVAYTQDCDNIWHKNTDVIIIQAANEEKLCEKIAEIEEQLNLSYSLELPDCVMAQFPGEASDYGAALINRGTPAGSVEGRARLTMLLFHTASFYGNSGRVTHSSELVPEHKSHAFTYRLYPYSGSYREGEVSREAMSFNTPLYCQLGGAEIANAPFERKMSFLKINSGFAVTAFKAAGYPMASMKRRGDIYEDGLELRGFETDGKTAQLTVNTAFELESAQRTDLLLQKTEELLPVKSSLKLSAEPNSIETLRIFPKRLESIGSAVIGREQELIEPAFVRSWEHDMGAQPMGFASFSAVIDRNIDINSDGTAELDINVCLSEKDCSCEVPLKIKTFGGVSVDRDELTVKLKSGESTIIFVNAVFKEGEEAEIQLLYEYDSQKFIDIFRHLAKAPRLNMSIDGDKILCDAENPSSLPLTGELYIATPFECWGELPTGSALMESAPFFTAVRLAPHEAQRFEFSVHSLVADFSPSFWAIGKLAAAGDIYFSYAHSLQTPHTVWAHTFYDEIQRSCGSISKLLELAD